MHGFDANELGWIQHVGSFLRRRGQMQGLRLSELCGRL